MLRATVTKNRPVGAVFCRLLLWIALRLVLGLLLLGRLVWLGLVVVVVFCV